MNQTFVCCSTYHIYLAILEAYKYKKMGYESKLVFITDKIVEGEKLIHKLEKIDAFKTVIPIKGYSILKDLKKRVGIFNYIFNRASALKEVMEAENPQLLEYEEFFSNSELNLFEINRTRAYFIIKYPNNFMRMHEDGLSAYHKKLSYTRIFNRKYITRYPLLKGHDKQVKEFLVQFPEKIYDKVLKDKVRKLDVNLLENGLTEQEKIKIVSIFLDDYPIVDFEKRALIITQPLSELDFMSESEKINLYKDMITDAINDNCKVYIKTHPRERTDYKLVFGDSVIVMPKLFPLEVFNLSKAFNFEKGYTYHSSALGNLKYINKKIFYDKMGNDAYNLISNN